MTENEQIKEKGEESRNDRYISNLDNQFQNKGSGLGVPLECLQDVNDWPVAFGATMFGNKKCQADVLTMYRKGKCLCVTCIQTQVSILFVLPLAARQSYGQTRG